MTFAFAFALAAVVGQAAPTVDGTAGAPATDPASPTTTNDAEPRPPPVPWEITGTSSTAAVPVVETGPRVQRRALVKAGRLVARLGGTYLSRGDLRRNPAFSAELGWYLTEQFGIDFLSATIYFSQLTETAAELRRSTGLLPDSQKPIARLAPGARYSLAYGKFLVEPLDGVVHVDAAAVGHLGVLITDATVNPALDVGLALSFGFGHDAGRGRPTDNLLLWFEARWMVSFEDRTTTSFASGPAATAGLGILF